MGRKKLIPFDGNENEATRTRFFGVRAVDALGRIEKLDRLRHWARDGQRMIAEVVSDLEPPVAPGPDGVAPQAAFTADMIRRIAWFGYLGRISPKVRAPLDVGDLLEVLSGTEAMLKQIAELLPADAHRRAVDVLDEEMKERGHTREEIAQSLATTVEAIDHVRKARPK